MNQLKNLNTANRDSMSGSQAKERLEATKKKKAVAKKMKISDHLKEAKRMERAGYGGSTEHEDHINKIYGWDRPNRKE